MTDNRELFRKLSKRINVNMKLRMKTKKDMDNAKIDYASNIQNNEFGKYVEVEYIMPVLNLVFFKDKNRPLASKCLNMKCFEIPKLLHTLLGQEDEL